MENLTKDQAISLVRWYESTGQSNWGGWSNYPTLPVGATYLQYDDNQCQVNLSETIMIDDEEVNCISHSRISVGKKCDKVMTFYTLKSWCLNEELHAEEAAKRAESNKALNEAKANFAKLPEAMQAELLSYTVAACGSNNKRKFTISKYVGENLETISQFFTKPQHVIKVVDCLQYNHESFSA